MERRNAPATSAKTVQKIEAPMESKKRILVVDDEQEITLVLRSGLATHGYEVRVAGEGEAALELFHAWTPDLVVTDLSMPNMNGLKTLWATAGDFKRSHNCAFSQRR